MSVVDDYLKKINPAQRAELERIRIIALEMLPGAEETILRHANHKVQREIDHWF